ncbi:Uu.00g065730.m01.CDS01 [Anthostomella pinea]|uniref:Nucleolar protein 2 n=1 Tax=Anthostomella pinea TaxID=933095 RepID=A0AAI8VV09_9PEZI|nr:Uu.00g065730.m01.CDS01 [Anthostomella pinea]
MGAGRRMGKKQGPPEVITNAQLARLKRKAGMPVDDVPADDSNKKRRRTAKETPAPKANGRSDSVKSAPVAKQNGRSKPTKAAPEPELEDDISDGIGEGWGDSDIEDGDEAMGGLGDDFLGSDDSVYDSDAEPEHRAIFSEDEDDSDDAVEKLTAANIEGLTRKLDEKNAREEAEAQAELEEAAIQTNIDVEKPHLLDDEDEDTDLAQKTKTLLAPDLQLLRSRITDTIRVLDDFQNLAETGRSRSEYTSSLLKDICSYYGYSEFLAEKLFNLFPPREALAFFDANETARPVVIRTNTLKTSRRELASALINRGVTLEPVGKWSKVGLQVFDSNVPLGATPEYLAGHYILQAASSFLPVMALAPQEGEKVLDMAAAPGPKSTHIAAMMNNTGCIFANDPNKKRAKALVGNIHRMGARNVIVCNYDAREFPKVMGGFDRVLLDAPCTGTGVVAKDPSVKTNKTEKDFMTLPHTQKQLLLCAIDSVNHASSTGGFVCYSTCSVSIEENEQVVQYALNKRPNVKLVSTDLPFGKEGFTNFQGKTFHPSLSLTRRFYPHTLNMDGFYVAKFQKVGPTPANAVKDKTGAASTPREEVVDKTPIAADEKVPSELVQDDGFGGFDDDEDEEYMKRAKRNAMRKRGLDPKALEKPKAQDGKAANAEVKEKGEAKPKSLVKAETKFKNEAKPLKDEAKAKNEAKPKGEGKTNGEAKVKGLAKAKEGSKAKGDAKTKDGSKAKKSKRKS